MLKIFSVAFMIICIVFGAKIISRNMDWNDPLRFYKNEIKHNDTSARLYNQIGIAYMERNQYGNAVDSFMKGISLDRKSLLPALRSNLGFAYEGLAEYDKAIHAHFLALELKPNSTKNLLALERIYASLGKPNVAQRFNALAKEAKAGEEISLAEIYEVYDMLFPAGTR